jgi:MraZ protein
VFTGGYRHSVDAKGRLAVPAKFRALLDSGAFVSRWLDACLAIWPRAEWDRLAAKVAALPIVENPGARLFSRFVFANAVEVVWDAQGRFVLPAYLRDAIGLRSEAMIVGQINHAEIWTPAGWDEYQAALNDPAAVQGNFAGLGF